MTESVGSMSTWTPSMPVSSNSTTPLTGTNRSLLRLGNRGVSACSYEARAFGVHSALPMYRARKLCPQAIYVRPRMERYSEMSQEVIALLKEFSPTVQQISIDEAFLDMTGTERLYGKPRQAAMLLKNRIKNERTLSVALGPRFIAAMASGYDKPDGLSYCR